MNNNKIAVNKHLSLMCQTLQTQYCTKRIHYTQLQFDLNHPSSVITYLICYSLGQKCNNRWVKLDSFSFPGRRQRSLSSVSNIRRSRTGLKNVCACARFHRWRQKLGHHTKPRKNGGLFKKVRMVPGLRWKGGATLKTVERYFCRSFLYHCSAHTFLYTGV